MVGIDPRPFTLYQLYRMCDGRLDALWTAVSSISYTFAMVMCDKKHAKRIKPKDFNWYASAKKKNRV